MPSAASCSAFFSGTRPVFFQGTRVGEWDIPMHPHLWPIRLSRNTWYLSNNLIIGFSIATFLIPRREVLLNHEERTIHTSHLSEHGFLFTFQASFFLGPQFYVPFISLPLKSMHGHQLQILVGSLFSNIKQFKKKAPHESRPRPQGCHQVALQPWEQPQAASPVALSCRQQLWLHQLLPDRIEPPNIAPVEPGIEPSWAGGSGTCTPVKKKNRLGNLPRVSLPTNQKTRKQP